MRIKNFLFVVANTLIMIAIISCGKSTGNGYGNTPPIGGTSSGTVNISGLAFKPATLNVKVGTKITWTNKDGFAHTVTSDDGTTFNSENLAASGVFTFTPTSAGTFDYHCNIHPGMTAKIVVTQ